MAGKYKTTSLALRRHGTVKVYASPKVGEALRELTAEMKLYQGVRLGQVLEAFYAQGKKDGAREAFAQVDKGNAAAKKLVPHRTPGRPKKAG